jgi:hypothetical protein
MKLTFAPLKQKAEVAQLVEHNLAKVGVASPSLVFRSKKFKVLSLSKLYSFELLSLKQKFCLGGGIGRHAGLKIL